MNVGDLYEERATGAVWTLIATTPRIVLRRTFDAQAPTRSPQPRTLSASYRRMVTR